MSKYLNAAERTRGKLRETFWSLYQKKPIEKITVREITEAAHYNRSTFYEYYSDVYAVLEEIEESLFDGMFKDKSQLILDYNLSIDEIIYDIAQNYKKYKRYLTALLGSHGDPQFLNKLKAQLKILLHPLVISADMAAEGKIELDYYLEYLTNGLMGMLMYWQQYNSKMPIEEFLKICREIIIPGKEILK